MASLPRQLLALFKALFRLARFWNLVILGLAQYFTAYFLIGGHTLFDWKLFLLVISTMMIAAGGYIINDYYDIKIDLINKPERVVIGKGMTRRYAIFFHTTISIAGVGIGYLLGWQIAVINFSSGFVLWVYSNQLKRQPFIGNFSIGLLTATSILIVNVLYPPLNSYIVIYSLFAMAITLIREIIKDMEDWKGDHTFGSRTLPIIWGIRKTKYLLYVFLIIFIALVLAINQLYLGLPIFYFLFSLFLPLGYLLIKLIRSDTVGDFAKLSYLCKLILIMGILSMALV